MKQRLFSADTYVSRRARLKQAVGSGLLLFIGNEESGMNYAGNTYPFRQDSTFLYYFGSDYAGACALIDIDGDREIIFADDLTIDDIVWMGSLPSVAERSSWVGIKETAPRAALHKYIKKALGQGQTVHYLPPYRMDHRQLLKELLGIPYNQQEAKASVPFIEAVVNMRNHKSEEEIAQIEMAVDTSVDMHLAAMKAVKPGMLESEVAAEVARVALRTGCEMSFPIIGTVNGHTLHNYDRSHLLREGQMFLLDAGAESPLHYAGDLSSTIPVGERFSERQAIIFDILLAAHRAATEALRPGINFRDVHLLAATKICEGLKGIGLVTGNPEEMARSGAYAIFFPCGLGHMMGLDVHDMENLGEKYVGYAGREKSTQFGFKSLRLARELEPGFVFTIEPGIYFIPELIDLWRSEHKFEDALNYREIDKWRGFTGLRNEEDYLITETGARRLGHKVKPLTRKEIEAAKG
ncbi:MAG: aminopeptidase P family protein [Prevotellaceae bacterium]|nr:aminopeptidase P family protein [Prevotellaceae bacterium]